MSRVRIILLNNRITSLFMAAELLRQEREGGESLIKNIAICSNFITEDSSDEKINRDISSYTYLLRGRLHGEYTYNIEGDYERKWFHIKINPLRALSEYFIRKKEIDSISDIVKSFCNDCTVSEVWSGSLFIENHIYSLFPNAKFCRFEHGLSDIISTINSDMERGLIRSYRDRIENKFMFFSCNGLLARSTYYSIMSKEIINSISNDNLISRIKHIDIKYINNVVSEVNGDIFLGQDFREKSVIILLPFIDCSSEKYFDYLNDIFNYLKCSIFDKKYKNKNIYLKARVGYNQSEPISIQSLLDLGNKVFSDNVVYEIPGTKSGNDYTIEYYLNIMKPCLIIGEFSSGLLYSKIINSDINTVSFNAYMNNIVLQESHVDYGMIDEFINWTDSSPWFDDIIPVIL